MGKYDNLYVKPLQRASSTWANSVVDALNELYDIAVYTIRFDKILDITSNYNANAYEFLLVDASSSPITITLPPATGWEIVIVKKTDSTGNSVTILPQSGKLIDSDTSLTLSTPRSGVILVADENGNWWVIARS